MINTIKRFWALCLDTHMKLALYKYAIIILLLLLLYYLTSTGISIITIRQSYASIGNLNTCIYGLCIETGPRMHFMKTDLFMIGGHFCPACRTSLIATRFWVVVICPIIKCLTVLEFYFILFDLCLFITIFNFILNYVPIVTFWIFTYHKIWILLIIFCFIWNYWIIYFLTCLAVFWSVVS